MTFIYLGKGHTRTIKYTRKSEDNFGSLFLHHLDLENQTKVDIKFGKNIYLLSILSALLLYSLFLFI